MPDVRWPKEWVEYRGPKGGFGYRFLAPRGYTSMRLTEMSVLVPVDEHGEPDIDGLLARLRFDPNHALPVAVGADCRTTHYACQCVMEQLERAEAEVERLRAALDEAAHTMEATHALLIDCTFDGRDWNRGRSATAKLYLGASVARRALAALRGERHA